MSFYNTEGREKAASLNPTPREISPDYNANVLYYKDNLRLGYIDFDNMSPRKPNMNKTYGYSPLFYTQNKNLAKIEHRPRVDRKVAEDDDGVVS